MTPLSLLLALVLVASACGSDAEPATSADLVFTDVWTREPAAGSTVAAVYATVTNAGESDITITGASVEVTNRVELHNTSMDDDGLMTMAEEPEGFVVPAGGSFTFEPGGPHVMLFDIDPAAYPSDALDVTFSFDNGEPTFASAQVRALDGDAADHSGHGDEDHGGDDSSG